MQARLDPPRMVALADDWQRVVDRIGDVLADLDRRLGAQLDGSWRGRGADASTDALRRYVTGSLDGLPACRSAAVRLLELSRAASDLRACVSRTVDEALVQVRERYSAPAVAAGNAVVDIPTPPDPFPVAGAHPAGTAPNGVPQSGPSAGVPQMPTAPAGSTPAVSSFGHPPTPGESPLPSVRPAQPWRAPTHGSALTSPGVDTMPARPDPSPSATSSPPGAGLRQSAVGEPRTAPSPSPSSVGAPFMGGMYPGHLGRDGGGEHRAPKYLISAGNSNELIGELPLVAPPVIGE